MVIQKCEHDKNKYKCRICNPNAFCEHKRYKYSCFDCKPDIKNKYKNRTRTKCEHKNRKDSCVICSGCIHKKLVCIECTPQHFCKHNKRKTFCEDCGGKSLCIHSKIKSSCKKCGGHSFCIHSKRKSLCFDCSKGKGSFCKHEKIKYYCVECKGSQICIHKKHKRYCKECNGTQICIHKKIKYFCIDCDGKGMCEHKIRKYDCKLCNPFYHFVNLQRSRLKNILKKIGKTHHTIEYLGCSRIEFYEYIKSKMSSDMTIHNIHLDHIKPVSKFDLSNVDEIYECCHWSNIQPLLAKDNLKKSNKWSEDDEKYWRYNIIKYNNEQRVSVDNS